MTPPTSLLTGRVALVTGASRGIGRACAIKLGTLGARIAVNYNKSATAADDVVARIKAGGGEATAVQGDVSDFAAAQGVVKAAIDAYGRLDILVNNAGTTHDGLLVSMKEEDFDGIIQQNLKSVFNCSRAVLRQMMKQRYGRIVNITSIVGIVGGAGQTNYSAAKAGIIGFTKAMAKEYGGEEHRRQCRRARLCPHRADQRRAAGHHGGHHQADGVWPGGDAGRGRERGGVSRVR